MNLREEGWWISEDPSEGVHQGNVFVQVCLRLTSLSFPKRAHAVTLMRYLVPDPQLPKGGKASGRDGKLKWDML